MKTLVYDPSSDSAKKLVARIAIAVGEIRDMPGIPIHSDFHAPEI